jgi:hypothetical protein
MTMSKRDDEAAVYYDSPEHRELTGRSRKRRSQVPRLNTHIPIRFSAAVIERVKELAANEGKTVSSWIRDLVDREVMLRERSRSVGVPPDITWRNRPEQSGTTTSGADDVREVERLAS